MRPLQMPLQPKPQQVRAMIEAESQSYENPAEVVKWFYMQPQRLSEMEGVALENNVVAWVLAKAAVTDKAVLVDVDTPEALGQTVGAELTRWARVVKAANITAQ